jgi:hypothetical protein
VTQLHMTPDRNRFNGSLDATRLASGTRSVPRGRRIQRSIFSILALTLLSQICSRGQQSDAPQNANDVPADYVLWIIPNFRTMSLPMPYRPVSAREKFQLATKDSFDRGTVGLVAVFAADGLATNSHNSFGQGSVGYVHYLATAYSDAAIGNVMTEAIFPSLLHEDPRFFRRGTGSVRSRLRYAVGQIFVTYTDSGEKQFNFAEFCGHSAAVAISMAYYPENRRASDAVSKLGLQIALGAAGNILKEFWPERRPHRDAQRGGKDAGSTN